MTGSLLVWMMKRSAASNFGVGSSTRNLVCRPGRFVPVTVVLYGSPYAAGLFPDAANIVVAYDDENYTQQCVAEALFGAKPFSGGLPVGSGTIVPEMDQTASLGRVQYGIPEDVGMRMDVLQRLDSLAKFCIDVKAAPGVTLLVMKDGRVVWDKTTAPTCMTRKHRYQPMRCMILLPYLK